MSKKTRKSKQSTSEVPISTYQTRIFGGKFIVPVPHVRVMTGVEG